MMNIAIRHIVAILLIGMLGQVSYSRDAAVVYSEAVSSVYTLRVLYDDGSTSTGSGFLLDESGLGVTAAHVIENATIVEAHFESGEIYDVSGVVDIDVRRDLAMIRVKCYGIPFLTLSAQEPQVGSCVYTIGAPEGLEFSVSEGIISQVRVEAGTTYLQFTCPVSPGNSGGPLLNESGEVVGVVSFQSRDGQNLNFAYPSRYVLGLDRSLPTQPWRDVFYARNIPESGARPAISDSMIVRAWVSTVELGDASSIAQYHVVWQEDGYKQGVPSFLYSALTTARGDVENINPPVSGGGASADLARHVHEYGSAAIEAGELLVSAIKAAQEGGGWTPKATDLLNQGAAKYGERKAIELGELLGLLRPIAGWLTDDQKMGARLLPDEPRLRMGVTSLGRDPLLFMQVGDDTLAEKLGFKHWDRLVKINGTKLSTLSEVYPLLSELAGERVEFELMRNGKNKKMTKLIPKDLGPYIQ